MLDLLEGQSQKAAEGVRKLPLPRTAHELRQLLDILGGSAPFRSERNALAESDPGRFGRVRELEQSLLWGNLDGNGESLQPEQVAGANELMTILGARGGFRQWLHGLYKLGRRKSQ